MTDVALPALYGRNPLGLFAALGALDVASRMLPDCSATLRWTDSLEPTAVLCGPDSLNHLVDLIEEDRLRWADSPILTWGPDGSPLVNLKPPPKDLRRWSEVVLEHFQLTGDRTDIDLFCGLVAEGATANKGDSKPTHFDFTTGNQKFLSMVRRLQSGVDASRIREALEGPWQYDSPLPVLRWDPRGERIYALLGFAPTNDSPLGVPGADWLAFLALRFFPVTVRSGRSGRPQLVTTACSPGWKSGQFTWPLWVVDLGADVVSSLVADSSLVALTRSQRRMLGIHHVLSAPIRRSDQGGYGSFGPSGPAVSEPAVRRY